MTASASFTGLVLAGTRRGSDILADTEQVSHKCLIDLEGRPMIAHVIAALAASPAIAQIYLATDQDAIMQCDDQLTALTRQGRLRRLSAGPTLFDTVRLAAAAMDAPYPLVITTGDNALLTPEIVDDFCGQLAASETDVGVGMTPAACLLAKYPDGARAFHQLKDGGWSSANLYALMTPRALKAAKAFEGGGQFGKKHSRILRAFGLRALFLYKFRLVSLAQMMRRLSARFRVGIKAVILNHPEAPIDVDNSRDLTLTRTILKERAMQP